MARILIYRICPTLGNGNVTTESFWDTDARTEVRLNPANTNVCSPFNLEPGTLIDSWFEGTTKVEIKAVWDGSGRPPKQAYTRTETANAGGGGVENPCGLFITDVAVTDTTVTVLATSNGTISYALRPTSDYNKPYSSMWFQASNVFPNPGAGEYFIIARTKNGTKFCIETFVFTIEAPAVVRFYMEFVNAAGKACRVNWYQRGWEDLPEEVRGADEPVVIDYPGIGNKMDTLAGSGLSINLVIDRYGLLNSFFTSDERKYRVEYLEDEQIIWQGWHIPDIYNEPWLSVPFRASLQAYDGIGGMDNMFYVDAIGGRYYGRARMIDVIARCLRKLDLNLPVWFAVNVWEDTTDLEVEPLAQLYVDQNLFYKDNEPLTCKEVLEICLKPYNAFIKQWAGALHVIRFDEQKAAYGRRKVILGNNDNQLQIDLEHVVFEDVHTIRSAGPVSYREANQNVVSRPAFKYVSSEVEYGPYENFIINGDFERWGDEKPLFWTGDANVERSLEANGQKFELSFLDINLNTHISNAQYQYNVSSPVGFTFAFDYFIAIDDYYSEAGYYWEVVPEFEVTDAGHFRITNVAATQPVAVINDTLVYFPHDTQNGITVRSNIPYPSGNARRIDAVVAKSDGTYEYIMAADSTGVTDIVAEIPANAILVTYVLFTSSDVKFTSVSDLLKVDFSTEVKIGDYWFYNLKRGFEEGGNMRFITQQRSLILSATEKTQQGTGYTVMKGTMEVHSISMSTPGLPSVRFKSPSITRSSTKGVYIAIDNVRLTERAVSNIDSMIISDQNEGIINTPPVNVQLNIGSGDLAKGPDGMPRVAALLTLADGSKSHTFNNGYLLQELTVRDLIAQHKRPTLVLSASLTGPVTPLSSLKDPFLLNSRFIVDRFSYRARKAITDIEAQEVFGGDGDLPNRIRIYENGDIRLTQDFDYRIIE